jgi:hypothetical protein
MHGGFPFIALLVLSDFWSTAGIPKRYQSITTYGPGQFFVHLSLFLRRNFNLFSSGLAIHAVFNFWSSARARSIWIQVPKLEVDANASLWSVTKVYERSDRIWTCITSPVRLWKTSITRKLNDQPVVIPITCMSCCMQKLMVIFSLPCCLGEVLYSQSISAYCWTGSCVNVWIRTSSVRTGRSVVLNDSPRSADWSTDCKVQLR